MGVRLQKIISQWGIASRRQAEEMIKLERVRVNGVLAHLGQKVNPETDTISGLTFCPKCANTPLKIGRAHV